MTVANVAGCHVDRSLHSILRPSMPPMLRAILDGLRKLKPLSIYIGIRSVMVI